MVNTDDLLDDISDRAKGTAISWFGKFGKVADEFGTMFNTDHRDLEPDFCGRLYLLENEVVSFRATVDHKSRRSAKDVKVISRPLHQVLPADYREIIEVDSIFPKGFGFATRYLITPDGSSLECGQLFLHARDFALRDFDSMQVGSRLNVAIAPPNRINPGWRATDIFVVGKPEIGDKSAATPAKQNIEASKHPSREQQKARGEKQVYADADATASLSLAGALSAALKGR